LEANVKTYNENASLIGLIPIDAKYSMNKNNYLMLQTNINDNTEYYNNYNNMDCDNHQNFKMTPITKNDILNGDIEDIKGILSKIKEHSKERNFNLQQELKNLNSKHEEYLKTCSEKENEIQDLESRSKHIQTMHDEEKKKK